MESGGAGFIDRIDTLLSPASVVSLLVSRSRNLARVGLDWEDLCQLLLLLLLLEAT